MPTVGLKLQLKELEANISWAYSDVLIVSSKVLERTQLHIPYVTSLGDVAGKFKRGIFKNTLKKKNTDASHNLNFR